MRPVAAPPTVAFFRKTQWRILSEAGNKIKQELGKFIVAALETIDKKR